MHREFIGEGRDLAISKTLNIRSLEEDGSAAPGPLPLDGERVVSFRLNGKKTYTHTLNRVALEDWIVILCSGVRKTNRFPDQLGTDAERAVRSLLLSAEGYTDRVLCSTPGWPELPSRHISIVGWLLKQVSPAASPGEEPPAAGAITVHLHAAWGSEAPGKMFAYLDLRHIFNRPTAEQIQRFAAASLSKLEAVRGCHGGFESHRLPGCESIIRLYDELVREVQGYSIGGRPLTAEQARSQMDACHKVVAAQQLFLLSSLQKGGD